MVTKHVDKTMDDTKITNVFLNSIIPPVIFALSIPIFFIDIQIAQYFWLIIIPAKIIV